MAFVARPLPAEQPPQRSHAAKDGKRLQPDRTKHPFEGLGAQLGDFRFKSRSKFSKPKIEVFPGHDGLADRVGDGAGYLLRLLAR